MRNIVLLALCLIFTGVLAAQPAYDNCPAFSVGVAPFCDTSQYFNNVNATTSNIGAFNVPPCFKGGDLSRDVFISFVASDTILDYVITVFGKKDGATAAMKYPEIALYRGDCAVDELALILCASWNNTSDTSVVLNANGLTPGATYYMRIHDNKNDGSNNEGSFVLCIKEKEKITNIINGFSNACSGKLVDDGGPNGDYSADKSYFYTICPSGLVGCIEFTFDYYSIDAGFDVITIYNGDTKSDPILATLSGNSFPDQGGGAVCYKVQANSGCISIAFEADSDQEFEGFLGSWQCSAAPCELPDVIGITPTATDAQIISAVSTPQTTVTIDTIICAQGAYGTFTATDNSMLGLSKGLILTSGGAINAIGPNNIGSATISNGGLGDKDLDQISLASGNFSASNDACIVELDVFSATDELAFEYIFGSEEYPEFVGSSFNDIFAFLISGPGIIGDPLLNNQKNIAVLPDGLTPTQINSVNNNLNWEYYRNNIGGQSIQYDGLTSDFKGVKKSLTAKSKVTPCNTYHLKLAIADRGDFSYDSGVFISDLKGGSVDLNFVSNSNINYMIESCTGTDEIALNLSNVLDKAVTYNIVIGGTATKNIDYTTNIPTTITLQPGETIKSFNISPLMDGLNEGTETITISLTNNFGCGTITYTTLSINLADEPFAEINAGIDSIYYCIGGKINLNVTGCQTYFWQPISIMDNFESPTPIATPTGNGYIFVTGQVGTCTAKDSVYAVEIDPKIDIIVDGSTTICEGKSLKLTAVNNTKNQGFSWFPPLGLSSTKLTNITAAPLVTTKYYAQINLSGCIVRDSVTIQVDPFDFPVIFNDTVKLCETYPVQLAQSLFFGTTQYQWTPALYLSDPTFSGAIATPEQDILYTLIATSQNGFCADTATVFVDVIEADVDILNEGIEKDTFKLCLGDSLLLNTSQNPELGSIDWSPKNSTIVIIGKTAIVKPTQSGWYVSKLTTSQCVVYDSVYVQVDSLPLNMTISPMDTTVCQGSIVVLKSTTYEQGNFPNLIFNWEPTFDARTPDSLYNIVIEANASYIYQRIAVSGACVQIDTSNVTVIPTNLLTVVPQNPQICPGGSIELTASGPGAVEYTWDPATGLNTASGPVVIATLNVSTTFTVSAEVEGCPVQGSVTVNVPGLPNINFPNDNILCLGESIVLNSNPDPNWIYSWVSTDPAFGTSTDPTPSASPLTAATYYVTITNALGCVAGYEFFVNVVPVPTLTVTDDITICDGNSVSLFAVSNNTGLYTWSTGSNSGEITVAPNTTTEYTVSFVDGNGCGAKTDTVKVTVVPIPLVTIIATPDTLDISQGSTVTLQAVLTNPSVNVTYQWFYQGQSMNLTTPSITVKPLESTSVYLVIATDPNGCKSTFEIVFQVTAPEFKIPNVFTPNGDMKNDVFLTFVKGDNLNIKQVKVFDRWGKIAFEADSNLPWDGNINGTPAPSDVYVYWIVIQTPTGEQVLRGDISLIR